MIDLSKNQLLASVHNSNDARLKTAHFRDTIFSADSNPDDEMIY
jgi:hypothetical protein